MDIDALRSLPDEELYCELLSRLDATISKGDDVETQDRIIKQLPKTLQMLFAMAQLEMEVDNGGFLQYFWNTNGEYVKKALAGFALIGAEEHANLVRKAVETYAQEKPRKETLTKRGALKAFQEAAEESCYEAFDDEYYELSDELEKIRATYFREHITEFLAE